MQLSNRMVVNVCIQLTQLNWCVYAADWKPFLWRILKQTFPAKYPHITNSSNTASKTQKNRTFHNGLLYVHSTKRGTSNFSFRSSWKSCVWVFLSEWEYTQYSEIFGSKMKTELSNRMVFNVCIQLTELNWCVFAGVSKPFLWRSGKRIFPAKCRHSRNSEKTAS